MPRRSSAVPPLRHDVRSRIPPLSPVRRAGRASRRRPRATRAPPDPQPRPGAVASRPTAGTRRSRPDGGAGPRDDAGRHPTAEAAVDGRRRVAACRRVAHRRGPGDRQRPPTTRSAPRPCRASTTSASTAAASSGARALHPAEQAQGLRHDSKDPEGRRTVMDLLAGVREYVYPVGRLDYDTEGLLLLTSDGDLAARLTHPRHEVPRVYEAIVLGEPDDDAIENCGGASSWTTAAPRRPMSCAAPPCRPAGAHDQAGPDALRGPQPPGARDVRAGRPPRADAAAGAVGSLTLRGLPVGPWRDLLPRIAALKDSKRCGRAASPRRRPAMRHVVFVERQHLFGYRPLHQQRRRVEAERLHHVLASSAGR